MKQLNKLELTDISGNTHIKINDQEIFRIFSYELKRVGTEIQLTITTSIDEKQSSINVVREYGTIKV